jgi:outer membrane protein assembly factor BamA
MKQAIKRSIILLLGGALCIALEFHFAQAQSGGAAADSVASADAVAPADSVPQRDIFDVLSHNILGRPRKPSGPRSPGLHWAILPTFSYNTVYGFAVGAMLSGAGQRGGEHSRYSALSLGGNYSTQSQKQAYVKGDLFSPGERFLLKGDLRYLETNRKTWGLGSFSSEQQKYPMSFTLSRAYATLYVRTVGAVFLGLGYQYDQFDNIVDERANKGEQTPFTIYSGGAVTRTVASGPSVNLLVDSRDNEVTPTSGCYLSTSFRDYLKSAGSDSDWRELWAELRLYTKLRHTPRNVLGLWLYGWGTSDKPPYLDLPSTGWDMLGRGSRGYVHGRIRGQDQLYAETEYRRTLTANGLFGVALFANAISTRETTTSNFESPDVAGGLGLRFRLNKHSRANLCVDYGQGFNHSSSHSWELAMNETF